MPGPRAAATAEFGALARSCPFNSMAPVLAIADLVADRLSSTPNVTPIERLRHLSQPGRPGSHFRRGASMAATRPLNRKQRIERARRLQSADPGLAVMHPNAAGIDVGNSSHYVAVRPDRDPNPVRRFDCLTAPTHRRMRSGASRPSERLRRPEHRRARRKRGAVRASRATALRFQAASEGGQPCDAV